jgi:hypothetical protein
MPPRGWSPTPEMIARRRETIQSRTRPFEERFWEKVDKSGDCWEWTAGRIPSGYGSVYYQEQRQPAHRVAWQLVNGPIPPGMFVCHHCDNPPCVRPDHLFLGTPAENSADRNRKGRLNPPRGERSPTRLTTLDVISIRDMRERGASHAQLGRAFGLSPTAIAHICHRRTWRHVA